MITLISLSPGMEGRNYCTTCDDYGHAAEDHRDIRNSLFDYMQTLLMEEQFAQECECGYPKDGHGCSRPC